MRDIVSEKDYPPEEDGYVVLIREGGRELYYNFQTDCFQGECTYECVQLPLLKDEVENVVKNNPGSWSERRPQMVLDPDDLSPVDNPVADMDMQGCFTFDELEGEERQRAIAEVTSDMGTGIPTEEEAAAYCEEKGLKFTSRGELAC